MVIYGKGTPRDDKKAIYWFTKAANKGIIQLKIIHHKRIKRRFIVFFNVAIVGQGTSQDNKKALYWYTKAAEQGDESQFKVVNGQGIPNDKGSYWYTKL